MVNRPPFSIFNLKMLSKKCIPTQIRLLLKCLHYFTSMPLALCMLGIFFFLGGGGGGWGVVNFSKKIFREYHISMSNSLDPDQVLHFVGPDPDPKCLQKLSAEDNTTSQKFNTKTGLLQFQDKLLNTKKSFIKHKGH